MKSVLVVDDEPQMRRMLAASLELAGYEVTAVGSGEDALAEIDRLLTRVRAQLLPERAAERAPATAALRRDALSRPDEPATIRLGDVHVDLPHRLVTRRGRRVALSAREFELLRYLLAHRNEVVSREQLLRDVWGYNEQSVSRTVDNYVAKLRTHLESRPHRPRLIVTVHGSGYQLLA
jgi:DNA-binding response OmpR family regulator